MNEDIELGDKVKDRVSGMVGIATARVEFLNGCVQYQVQPPMAKGESKMPEEIGVDEEVLKVVSKGEFGEQERSGGPINKLNRNKTK